ncbi:MAG: peptidyl-prolyl cis-trans isomerase [Chitinivibrionales bacterium]|nr:peptidyl-prolyl cis-trans isomerase [Chitinivibrionales bacterium]
MDNMKGIIVVLVLLVFILPCTVHSQHIQPQSDSAQNQVSSKKSSTKSTIVGWQLQSREIITAIKRLSTICDTMIERNFPVTAQEIDGRLSLVREVCPQMKIERNDIKKALSVENFIKKNYASAQISPESMAEKYEAYQITSSEAVFSKEKMTPLLESMILVNTPRVETEIARKNQKRFQKWTEIASKYHQTWPQEGLYLSGLSDECLAFGYDSCLITLQMYNECVPFMQIPTSVPGDSVHMRILSEILTVMRKAQLAAKADYSQSAECVSRTGKILQLLPLFQRFGRHKFLGSPGPMDDNSLWQSYTMYYDRYFRGREQIKVGIIGSSDSLYIDSLYSVLKQSKGGKAPDSGGVTRLPWLVTNNDYLPSEVLMAVDTLRSEGSFTKPVKTAFGFFILKLEEVIRFQEISFEEAKEKLILLAMKDRNEPHQNSSSDRFYEYYEWNKKRFVAPDTFSIVMWLVPSNADLQQKKTRSKSKGGNNAASAWHDALPRRSISAFSTDLPKDVRVALEERNRKTPGDTCVGPVASIYGTWYFKIMKIRRGGRQLPYSEVKGQIEEELGRHESILASGVFNSAKNWYLPLLAVAKAYEMHLYEKYEAVPMEQIDALIKSGELKIDSQANRAIYPNSKVGGELQVGLPDVKESVYIKRQAYKDHMTRMFNQLIREWICGVSTMAISSN